MKFLLRLFIICSLFWHPIGWSVAPEDLLLGKNPVVDEARILTTQETQTLNQKLHAWYAEGVMQAAVVIVPHSNGEETFPYAMKIFERWQLGDKGRDNGLLLFINIGGRELRIVTGYGLEGALPDISAARIIRQDITPHFKEKAYFAGINQGLDSIAAQLMADPETRAEIIAADQKREGRADFIVGLLATMLLSALFVWFTSFILLLIPAMQRHFKKVALFFSVLIVTLILIADGSLANAIAAGIVIYGGLFVVLNPTEPASSSSSNAFLDNNHDASSNKPRRSSGSSSNNENHYRGGGGRSGGGGAGGSW